MFRYDLEIPFAAAASPDFAETIWDGLHLSDRTKFVKMRKGMVGGDLSPIGNTGYSGSIEWWTDRGQSYSIRSRTSAT
jgi:hypothetical protein